MVLFTAFQHVQTFEDNEDAPPENTLDWLNLNALGSRAIQGAIDRMRASTLGGEAEAGPSRGQVPHAATHARSSSHQTYQPL